MKMKYLSCAVLVLALASESLGFSDIWKEVESLHGKYNVNRDVVHASAVTNHHSCVFFEFEIPHRRQFCCATIMSNDVSVTLYDKNGISKQHATGIDIGLMKSFQQGLLTYKYEPLSVTTGPKYVYVTICSTQNQCYKFDYPWWVSSCQNDIPPGMLLGLNTRVSNVYRIYKIGRAHV